MGFNFKILSQQCENRLEQLFNKLKAAIDKMNEEESDDGTSLENEEEEEAIDEEDEDVEADNGKEGDRPVPVVGPSSFSVSSDELGGEHHGLSSSGAEKIVCNGSSEEAVDEALEGPSTIVLPIVPFTNIAKNGPESPVDKMVGQHKADATQVIIGECSFGLEDLSEILPDPRRLPTDSLQPSDPPMVTASPAASVQIEASHRFEARLVFFGDRTLTDVMGFSFSVHVV